MEVLLAGLMTGFVHVLAGPDHLAAVAPLAVEERRRAWNLGLHWGLGHSGGVLIIGAGALLLRGLLPVALLSSFSERLVGVVLIALGIWMLRQAFNKRIHMHDHVHHGNHHTHFHIHDPATPHTTSGAHRHTHAALAVGTLHGLAGSAHLLGILPALALPTNMLAAGYMLTFALGTVAGMMVFSSVIGWIAGRFADSSIIVYRVLTVTCALTAIVVGGVWLTL